MTLKETPENLNPSGQIQGNLKTDGPTDVAPFKPGDRVWSVDTRSLGVVNEFRHAGHLCDVYWTEVRLPDYPHSSDPSTLRRVYTTNDPEPPADVTVLRDSSEVAGEPAYLSRHGVGWAWCFRLGVWLRHRPDEQPFPEDSVPWRLISEQAYGPLIEWRPGDPTGGEA